MASPPIDYYVDPSIAAASGAGTIGDPYGDIQHALDTITRNATDGDRINIKAGTAEILAAALTLATYGTPAFGAPLIIQGYTTAQGDRGMGAIDCQTFTAMTNAGTGIYWYDMEVYDGPAAGSLITVAQYSVVAGCYIHDSTGFGVNCAATHSAVIGNHFEDLGDSTHSMLEMTQTYGSATNNYFKQGGARTCKAAIRLGIYGLQATNNIISIDGASIGILCDSYVETITGNTIFSAAGTGIGLSVNNGNSPLVFTVFNNYVEGFSGTGGDGLYATISSQGGGIYGQNAFYNNTTNVTQSSEHYLNLGDNEVLASSGIAKSGADTYANRFVYYAPLDVTNMQSGGYPEA